MDEKQTKAAFLIFIAFVFGVMSFSLVAIWMLTLRALETI